MAILIEARETFVRRVKWFYKHYPSFPKDFDRLIAELKANPNLGTDLGGGIRKIRMQIASKNKGKSGGARVISATVYTASSDTQINLLFIYDKAERETISQAEIEELLLRNGLK